MFRTKTFRYGSVLLAAGFALAAARCSEVNDLLSADNPAQINENQLQDEALADVMANSVLGAMTTAYSGTDRSNFIWMSSMFTDEQVTGINWEETARLNLRIVRDDDGPANSVFGALSRLRFLADSISGRYQTLLKEPTKDRRMALVLAHAGYAYEFLAEIMCEATVDVGAKVYTPKELSAIAITKFEQAIQVATATGPSADDVKNLARVGLARAALQYGDKAKAMSAASQVPLTFAWWVEYKTDVVNNGLYDRVTGTNHSLGVAPHFLNGTFGTQNLVATQTDPRIQHTTTWTLGHNQLTKLYKPYQSLPYSGFNGQTIATGGKPILYERDTDVKLASGLEAMHDYYEAAGPTGTGPRGTTLDFVNERRAFGKQAAVNLTGDSLMAELREQRGRDNYLGGLRLGDFRRWKAQNVGDFFPKGAHVNAEWGNYGTAECFPLPSTEYDGNPNLKK